MGEPRGDIETRIIRKLVHLDMHDLNLVNRLIGALASPERIKPNNRSIISQKLITTVQEIKNFTINPETIANRIKYPKR